MHEVGTHAAVSRPVGSIRLDPLTVLTGSLSPLGARGQPSGIAKRPVEGPWTVTRTGLQGDHQGDLKHHGGPEKALHHYAFEHYAGWIRDIGNHAVLSAPGAFGENLSTSGVTEADIHIGDIFRFGPALLQVSQGRQPCWKLNARFGRDDMARKVQDTGRTGWYYRVLEEGIVEPGATLELCDRPQPQWPLTRIIELLYRRTLDIEALATLAGLPELADSWRQLAARRVETNSVENWNWRLSGRG